MKYTTPSSALTPGGVRGIIKKALLFPMEGKEKRGERRHLSLERAPEEGGRDVGAQGPMLRKRGKKKGGGVSNWSWPYTNLFLFGPVML